MQRKQTELSEVELKASYKSKEYQYPNPSKIDLWIKALVAREVLRRFAQSQR